MGPGQVLLQMGRGMSRKGFSTPFALVFIATSGCSFHDFQERRLHRGFRHAGMERSEVDLAGDTVVRVWEGGRAGAKDTVLLLHGFGGDTAWQWGDQLEPLLEAGYRVIAPDLLWFGGSSSTAQRFGVEFQTETMVGLLDHLAVDQFDLVGISYGGLVAFWLTNSQPDRVDRLVLVDSPGPTYTYEDYLGLLERWQVNSVGELVVPESADQIRRLLGIAFYEPPRVPSFILKDIFKGMYRQHVEEKQALINDLLDRRSELEAVSWSVPHETLILWGDHDPLFPVEIGRRLAEAMGDRARFELIQDAAHAPNLERPDSFNRALLHFLREGQ